MNSVPERGLWLPEEVDRRNLATFVERARRLDDAAVIRVRQRSDGVLVAWVSTGFDVLACRVVGGTVRPADICAGADALAGRLESTAGYVDPGFPMDSAWRGALPPESGFVHIDDVPAREVLELAQQGVDLSREQGSHGPPVSLLDQDVISVSGAGMTLGIPMRCVFALTAMGFADTQATDEIVRVRTLAAWLRIDARFGSVYRRRSDLLRLV